MWKTPTAKLFGGGIKVSDPKTVPLDKAADDKWLKEEKERQRQKAEETAAAAQKEEDASYDELMAWQEQMNDIYDDAGNIREGKEAAAEAAIADGRKNNVRRQLNDEQRKDADAREAREKAQEQQQQEYERESRRNTQNEGPNAKLWNAFGHVKNVATAATDLGASTATSTVRAVGHLLREYPQSTEKFFNEFDLDDLKRKATRLTDNVLDAGQAVVDEVGDFRHKAADERAKRKVEKRHKAQKAQEERYAAERRAEQQRQQEKAKKRHGVNYGRAYGERSGRDYGETNGDESLRDTDQADDERRKESAEGAFQTNLYAKWKAAQEEGRKHKDTIKQHVKEQAKAAETVFDTHAERVVRTAKEKVTQTKAKVKAFVDSTRSGTRGGDGDRSANENKEEAEEEVSSQFSSSSRNHEQAEEEVAVADESPTTTTTKMFSRLTSSSQRRTTIHDSAFASPASLGRSSRSSDTPAYAAAGFAPILTVALLVITPAVLLLFGSLSSRSASDASKRRKNITKMMK